MSKKIRRRVGLLLFGVVLVLLGKPLPMAHCEHCGYVVNALCTEHIAALKAGSPR